MIKEKLGQAVWISHTLFQLGKTSGSTGNISFLEENKIYMSRSGACFGTMIPEDFSVMDIEGNLLDGKKPSKEFPLHLSYYKRY
ncbi:MAG: class II aldolase/adducin family protein, partial [Bariatricus sp.]